MTRLELAGHVAHLNVETGDGLLVCPPAREDVWLGTESLHAASWQHVIQALDGLGWEPSEAEDGGLIEEGARHDGGVVVVGLYGRDPIRSEPSLEDQVRAFDELRMLVGLPL